MSFTCRPLGIYYARWGLGAGLTMDSAAVNIENAMYRNREYRVSWKNQNTIQPERQMKRCRLLFFRKQRKRYKTFMRYGEYINKLNTYCEKADGRLLMPGPTPTHLISQRDTLVNRQ